MHVSWSAVPDFLVAGQSFIKVMCAYDLYVTFQ